MAKLGLGLGVASGVEKDPIMAKLGLGLGDG